MSSRRVCIPSGYRYEFTGRRDRRGGFAALQARDASWEIEVGKAVCGTLVGARRIDGAPCTVISVGRKAKKRYYAATSQSVKRGK